jgi:integrase
MAADFLDGLVERGLSRLTRNFYASLFSAIFKSAIRRERATVNPFDGQRVKAATVHYEPFTDQELAILFADAKLEIAPVRHTAKTALPWCALISAFTGCRREEVAQLKASDIKRAAGVWYFEFCQDGNGKRSRDSGANHRGNWSGGWHNMRYRLQTQVVPSLKGRKS